MPSMSLQAISSVSVSLSSAPIPIRHHPLRASNPPTIRRRRPLELAPGRASLSLLASSTSSTRPEELDGADSSYLALILAIDAYKPQDATTNPSLILAASKQAAYAKLIDVAIKYAKDKGGSIDEQVELATDRLVCAGAGGGDVRVLKSGGSPARRVWQGDPRHHPRPRLDRGRRIPLL